MTAVLDRSQSARLTPSQQRARRIQPPCGRTRHSDRIFPIMVLDWPRLLCPVSPASAPEGLLDRRIHIVHPKFSNPLPMLPNGFSRFPEILHCLCPTPALRARHSFGRFLTHRLETICLHTIRRFKPLLERLMGIRRWMVQNQVNKPLSSGVAPVARLVSKSHLTLSLSSSRLRNRRKALVREFE
jgi:hypothetical protein